MFLLLPLALLLPIGPAADDAAITVHCDPRVELLTIVFRLAGNDEFHMDSSASPYSRDVDAWFAPFREHQAVLLARSLRALHGICYNAVPDLAVHLGDAARLEERLPLDPRPERLDARWTRDRAAPFLPALRTFVRDTKFAEFTARHEPLYAEAASRLAAAVSEAGLRAWVQEFFGPGATSISFALIPGLLCGGGNYGSSVRFPDGRLELTPVMGIWNWDEKGLPLFGEDHIPTVAHEYTHAFANPVIEQHAGDFEAAGIALFRTVEAPMRAQAYGNWRIMLCESLVRGCVVRYVERTQGAMKARAQARSEEARGFRWTGELAELLAEYESDRKAYPTLDAFAPRLVAFFEEQAERIAELPQVVSIEPAAGAVDVDPSTSAIKVTFDRAMKDGSWSVTGGGPNFPPGAGNPSYDEEHRTFSLPVKLAPGKTYRFGLNGPDHEGFASAEGIALPPLTVTFTTRGSKVP